MTSRGADLPDLVALREVVTDGLPGLLGGVVATVMEMRTRPSMRRTSLPLHDVDVHLMDGRVIPLVCKELSLVNVDGAARLAKHADLFDPQREIGVYAQVFGARRLETAALVGIVPHDGERGPWLVLERTPGTPLTEHGIDSWMAAAIWYARMHDELAWIGGDPLAADLRLIRHDESFWIRWSTRAATSIQDGADIGGASAAGSLRRVLDAVPYVAEMLSHLPVAFLHGEAFPSNIVVERLRSITRVHVVDWEMAAIGPPLLDLAALTAGWPAPDAARIAAAYLGSISRSSGPFADAAAFDVALDACRVAIAVQWLGWEPTWVPPADHVCDWLAVAGAALDRLRT